MRILYLDLDTLRPDHLGCYGYHRNTSPNLDQIAREGMRFDQFYCSDAPCLPSRAAMMTSRFGIHNGVINHGGTCADRPADGSDRNFRDSLANGGSFVSMIRQSGLHTAYIGGFGDRHSAYWYYAGFHEIHDTKKGGDESAEDVTPTALEWIDKNAANQDWYLHVNYWDPHTPYRTPADFENPFKNEPLPDWMTEDLLKQHWQKVGPHSAQDFMMFHNRTSPKYPKHPGEVKGIAGWRQVIDGYDSGIRYMDDHIGKLLAALKAKGVLDDLVIMVSSDHGENFGEHGIYGEHATADEATCRIPMIIRWPGKVKPGSVDTGLHYNIDLAPTCADMLGQPQKPYWDGQSFSQSLMANTDCGREELILSQCCHVCQRSVRWGDWLYIRTYHDGFHLFADELLFNIRKDPHQQVNLAPSNPALVHEAAWRLMRWHDQMMATMPRGRTVDPLRIVLDEGGPFHARGALKKYATRLEATGRGGAALEELKRRHPREFIYYSGH